MEIAGALERVLGTIDPLVQLAHAPSGQSRAHGAGQDQRGRRYTRRPRTRTDRGV